MHIHHLNCGTHCPIGGSFYDGRSRGLHADICTHCLLIETDGGLVLVDTGYGIQDVRRARLAPRHGFVETRFEPAIRRVHDARRAASCIRAVVLYPADHAISQLVPQSGI